MDIFAQYEFPVNVKISAVLYHCKHFSFHANDKVILGKAEPDCQLQVRTVGIA